ncbi:MAG: citramalate synthase [Fusobacteriaceae bacterium]|nr:citramalate synthase [Fusobacteriaceae bacterium]MBN2838113.1 citramalate synthase [Fusobacteriaceae bacterium]
MNEVKIYDTTLRDGSQMRGIRYSIEDKIKIIKRLDKAGIHYIECGWPSSNPTDRELFEKLKDIRLENSIISAFGSTRHYGNSVENDLNIKGIVESGAKACSIFGKAWDLHVTEGFGIPLEENLKMVEESVDYLKKYVNEVFFIGEHFFDGYKQNREYALEVLKRAEKAGADLLILADTNGGTQYFEIGQIIDEVKKIVNVKLGIHCHNDSGLAVANSLEAVRKGIVQIQGTINGYGERCGNANLCELIPNLQLKMGYDILGKKISYLTPLSKYVSEITNLIPPTSMPFVGSNAFTHKGGIHVSAVMKNSITYEHMTPEEIGNRRNILISDLSGKSNVLYKLKEFNMEKMVDEKYLDEILKKVKEFTKKGYDYEGADGSFQLLIKKIINPNLSYFEPIDFRVITEKIDGYGTRTEATNKLKIKGRVYHTVAEGNGPVNAINISIKKGLEEEYPFIKDVNLIDYKVRIVEGMQSTKAIIRVLIESRDEVTGEEWSTIGVSTNILKASWRALLDSFNYYLYKRNERENYED